MDKNFIITTDDETAEKLKELGFEMISSEGGRFTFINNISDYSKTGTPDNVIYSNTLHI